MNKRQKYTTILLTGTAVFSTLSVSLPYHFSNSKTRSSLFFTKNSDQPLLINKENLDLNKAYDSSSDFNIHDKPKESKPEPKPEPIPPVKVPPIVKPKPIETPKPQPKPQAKPIVIPIETPKPQPKPEPKPQETPKQVTEKIKTEVGEIEVTYTPQPPRIEYKSDVEAGITNRVQYIAQLTPDVNSVKPSAENIAKSISNGKQSLKNFNKGFFGKNGAVTEFFLDNYKRVGHDETQDYLNRTPSNLDLILKVWDKYRLLIEAGNARQYMTNETQANYDEWFNKPETFKYIPPVRGYGEEQIKVGHLWIAMNIDPDKFTELSDELKRDLDKGFYIDEDNTNVYVDKDGKLKSYAVSPIFNAVVSEIERNNLEKRVFGSKSKWNRHAGDIENGNYPGWNRTDVTAEIGSKYSVSGSDGFKIERLTKTADNPSKTPDGSLIVSIDVENPKGYEKSINFIKQAQANGEKISGYRIKNIGRVGATQDLKQVLAQLPQKLPLLELFFESFNSSSLIALKGKEIDELGLYTSQNSLSDEWAINPWSLDKVAYVNMADYNVSSEYSKYARIFTRITFDSLRFDEEDWVSENDLNRINLGLRMAYFVRNNERIFQGGWGAGLKPDHDSNGNSYPLGLDLSGIPQAKGLKNMVFYDITKGPYTTRKLKRIVLFNDSETWETDIDNLNQAQFSTILDKQGSFPRSKILFSNKDNTKSIKIKPNVHGLKLNSEGLANLSTLIAFSNGVLSKTSTKIFVPVGEENLYNQLSGLGYQVQYKADGDDSDDLA
ncbi:putative immunoglobulin-blocking virulence protein [Mycoplasma leonicaptivi]|uniref:putative immunoglobulin-blocking virulence protein n=1 Tax=Mycoplasma leonicaptivi TaxID=36742 RepID=UPI0006852BB5|nr:putative immunoglobulin-blocking virulence protein [Mycoplasma leonicaptivi]